MIEQIAEGLNLTRWQSQLVVTAGVVALLGLFRWIVLTLVHRRIDDAAVWYRTRKAMSYVITAIGVVVLASVWLEGSGLATYIGLLTAGTAYAVEPKTEQLFTQLLFSYKLNPQTVVFIGYSDTALGFEDLSLTRIGRTFFVKLGYAWLL